MNEGTTDRVRRDMEVTEVVDKVATDRVRRDNRGCG